MRQPHTPDPSRPALGGGVFALLMGLALGCSDAPGPADSAAADTAAHATAADADAVDGAVGEELDVGTENTSGGLPAPVFWTANELPNIAGALYDAHPEVFARLSRWRGHVADPERPDLGHRGSFGVGNGHVFAFVGLADPLNTLHSLTGPTYERQPWFFGDYRVLLRRDGETLPFDEEWATRSLLAPVLFTRGHRPEVELDTVDFAPWTADPALSRCFVRILTVRALDAPLDGLHLRVESAKTALESPAPGVLVEVLQKDEVPTRHLVTRIQGLDAEADPTGLTVQIGALAAGASRQLIVTHCAQEGPATLSPGDPTPAPLDVDELLKTTAAAYQSWDKGLLQLDTPDPMVADFFDGMKQTLKVQQSAQGATCPMSEYTRTWLRDNIGPVKAELALGAHDDVRAMLDYVYGAAVLGGDFSNSFDADLALGSLPDAPDWGPSPTLGGKVAAETPSYVVWTYGLLLQHTGQSARAAQRWGFLRRGLMAQAFGPEGLLPFTGDETYRAAMNAAFGLPIEAGHAKKSWSTNSSLLWLGAQRAFEALAQATDHAQDAADAAAQAQIVRDALLKHMRLEDGCLSALVDRESMTAWPAPFEDVALKMTWAGGFASDDPVAQAALECLIGRVQAAPGVLQSPLHPLYQTDPVLQALFGAQDGVYTGMKPGYTLWALADAGHPDAEAAFNAVADTLTPSGNAQEYKISDDNSGVSLVYDDQGGLGDYTARFRPWEGGIILDAVIHYLTGFEPDARQRLLRLRPHLPNGWPEMAARQLRIGDDRFDLEVRRMPGQAAPKQGAGGRITEVRVRSAAKTAYTLVVVWDEPGDVPAEITRDGAPLTAAQRGPVSAQFGMQTVEAGPINLPAGATVTLRFRRAP